VNTEQIKPLIDLGFTEIEARVYLCLLQRSPLTGYAIAKAIGKATANTYKAIEGLARKDAIMVDEGESRLCRAVQPEDMLRRIRTNFERRSRQALDLMSNLRTHREDQRIYQLKSSNQVLDKVRKMLTDAREVVVADLFPAAVNVLRADLINTAKRGIKVWVSVYESVDLGEAQIMLSRAREYAVTQWPGTHLALVCDAEQHLYALLSADLTDVEQAIWSESTYLSCMAHNHLAAEFELASLYAQNPENSTDVPIRLMRDQIPGFKLLQKRNSNPQRGIPPNDANFTREEPD